MKAKFILLVAALFIYSVSSAQVPELWGMATYGGTNNYGTIFKVNGDGTGFSAAHLFDSINGMGPQGALCLAPNGKLYGMTLFGGTSNFGTLFSFNPSGNIFTKIVDFDLINGGFPWGTMMRASDNKLYGATYSGGVGTGGSIFKLDPVNDSYTLLYSLTQATDGGGITDKLIQATNGKLYGMAAYGGNTGDGTIFNYDIATNTFTKIHDFDLTNGGTPYGTLCEATNGFMYGMTYDGGANNNGVLFKLEVGTNVYTKIYDFNITNGQTPWNSIIQVTSTKLYGLVTGGGTGGGVIFSYDISTGTYTIEHNIDLITEGSVPWGSLIQASDGMLYSTLSFGPLISPGAVFKFNTNGNVFTLVHDFVIAEGSNPTGDLVEYISTGITELNAAGNFSIYPNPNSGNFTVERMYYGEPVVLSIYSGDGKFISRQTLNANTNYVEMKQPAGTYFLNVENKKMNFTREIQVR